MSKKSVLARIRLFSVLFMALFLTTLAVTAGICTKAYAEPYKVSFVSSKDLSGTGPSVLYQPTTPGANSQIGIMIMHPSGNHLEHPTVVGSPDPGTTGPNGPGLASLGYTVLALTSTMSSDDLLDTDKLFLQVSKGVTYLRKVVGNNGRVVLLGHSGGGPTMAGYQFIAENGVKACQGPEKIIKCPDTLAGMPPADGLIILDSSLGFGAITLVTLDPAVANEDKATQLTPSLNLYNPQNGFHPPTGGTYSSAFIQNYTAAQAIRMEKLIQTALGRLAQLNAGNGEYENDEPFDIPGSNIGNPQMWSLDLNVWAYTRDPHWLVKPNGGIVYGVVPSLRSPYTTTSSPTTKSTGGYLTTVRRFLNTWACRPLPNYGYGANYVSGIDYQSTYNSPVAAVEGIKKPLLVLGMSAGQLLVSDETIFQHAVSTDKRLVFIEGATHMTTPISAQYGNTTATTVNEIDKWLHGVRY